jgi:DNA primase
MTGWVRFRQVKEQVQMVDVIQHYGVKLEVSGVGCLRGRCPLPTHNSRDSSLSFSINTAKNAWACHSRSCVTQRGGSLGGNVLDFVATMEGLTIRGAALLLQEWFGASPPFRSDDSRAVACAGADGNRALEFRLVGVDPTHPYVGSRGISLATARLFGIGYYAGRGFLSGRVVIPIQNYAGDLVAYAGRSVDGAPPKYRLPPSFRKSYELFNLHRAARCRRRRVVVVEGFFDCINVHQAGYPNVVALMGCSLSDHQADLILRWFGEAVLLLDGDEAGQQATKKIAARLSETLKVFRAHVPAGRQPDELLPEELCSIIEGAM